MTHTAPVVVSVRGVTKRFRLYDERNQSLKAAIMRRRRARYREFVALDDVSLDISEGSTVGFIGENGSGKSTLLKCIAKILRPNSGEITVDGKVSALLELGAGFHPELSGRENVYLNGSILGLSKRDIDARFDDIVGFAGLEQFIDTAVKNYSSGMYVRLGFSVAINVDPDILLVDEVLAVGDESFQQRCAEKFQQLRVDGKTIVVVSHGMASLRTLCDTVVWLAHGRIRDAGSAAEVIDAYVGEMHEGRAVEGEIGRRWGSGEATIERIELLDGDEHSSLVQTGATITIRLHYRARQALDRPVFGIALHTLEGAHVTGPNTREAGIAIDRIEGEGVVDFVVDRLLLLQGTYDISTAIVDDSMTHTYDYRQRALRFDVTPGEPHETFGGVVSLDGRWGHDGH